MANGEKEVLSKFEAYKNGEVSRDLFMKFLLDMNEDGKISDEVYQKYADEISCDIYLED